MWNDPCTCDIGEHVGERPYFSLNCGHQSVIPYGWTAHKYDVISPTCPAEVPHVYFHVKHIRSLALLILFFYGALIGVCVFTFTGSDWQKFWRQGLPWRSGEWHSTVRVSGPYSIIDILSTLHMHYQSLSMTSASKLVTAQLFSSCISGNVKVLAFKNWEMEKRILLISAAYFWLWQRLPLCCGCDLKWKNLVVNVNWPVSDSWPGVVMVLGTVEEILMDVDFLCCGLIHSVTAP